MMATVVLETSTLEPILVLLTKMSQMVLELDIHEATQKTNITKKFKKKSAVQISN